MPARRTARPNPAKLSKMTDFRSFATALGKRVRGSNDHEKVAMTWRRFWEFQNRRDRPSGSESVRSHRLANHVILAAVALGASVPTSEAAGQVMPVPVAGPIESLRPGQYLWAPQIAPEGPVIVIVSLSVQRAFVYRNGVPIAVSTISSGKRGHETPTGVFTILEKDIDHRSNKYSNAPMPYMQRLTWAGVAMHAGRLPGYPASHGCIRLPFEFAKLLFAITRPGLTVVVTKDALAPQAVATPLVLDNDEPEDSSMLRYRWEPGRQASGPISVLISGRDRQLVVLRNGVEIGSSEVKIDGPVDETLAFSLSAVEGGQFHWLRLPLPGCCRSDASEMTAEERGRVHMPEAFRAALAATLKPGATLLVVRETLPSKGIGARLILQSSAKASRRFGSD